MLSLNNLEVCSRALTFLYTTAVREGVCDAEASSKRCCMKSKQPLHPLSIFHLSRLQHSFVITSDMNLRNPYRLE